MGGGGPPMEGLAGLEKLSICWDVEDMPNRPGSSLARLYEFIRPTLTTLVELRIGDGNHSWDKYCGDFDVQQLKPAANTLRTFRCTLQSCNESILDTIPAILPQLTNLSIIWDIPLRAGNRFTTIFWKACAKFFYSTSRY